MAERAWPGERLVVADDELDVERVGGRVITARCVVARVGLRLPVLAGLAVGEEQLHVIVEAEAGEAFEVAAERHADHVRGNLIDALDDKLAAAR